MKTTVLNERQQAAVSHVDGPMVILAGAGSGKTRVITYRILHLLEQGIAGENILAIAFTNKAAKEMRARASDLFPHARVTISTFHSFCCRTLRRYISRFGAYDHNFVILDSDDVKGLLKKVIKELGYDPTAYAPREVAGAISGAKNRGVSVEAYKARAFSYRFQVIGEIFEAYEKTKSRLNMVDFDDLLVLTLRLLKEHKDVLETMQDQYRYIMIDEYQDTNRVQYEMVKALAAKYRNLCVTGDPDQAIYSWRGATIRNILDFEKDYPDHQTVILGENYRSTKNILGAADSLIRHNRQRKDKELWTENEEGEKVEILSTRDESAEAKQIAERIKGYRQGDKACKDMAIIYRINALSRSLEEALVQARIPYQVIGGVGFYERKEIKDAVAFLRLSLNNQDDYSFMRIINEPSRGLGLKFLEGLQSFAKIQGCPLFAALADEAFQVGLSARQKVATQAFVRIIETIGHSLGSPVEATQVTLEESGYIEHLRASKKDEDVDRIENLNELVSAATLYEQAHPDGNLSAFLENIALVTDLDKMDDEGDVVSLMSLHAVKGLEFPVVFIAGVEKDILPHRMASESDDRDDEEERRLFYVGITRAMQCLHISYATSRMIYGRTNRNMPSPFLDEINEKFLFRKSSAPGFDRPYIKPKVNWDDAFDAIDDLPDDDGTVKVGDMVAHNIFGTGRVTAVSGNGDQARVEVDFTQAGHKKLAASFVRRLT